MINKFLRLTLAAALASSNFLFGLAPASAQGFESNLHMPGGAISKESFFELAKPSSRLRPHENTVLQSPLLTKPRVCLVLGGGGTRGGAHVGVLKVFTEAGIPIDCIAGTSIGAIVGGFYCAGISIPELEAEMRNNTIMRNYLNVPLKIRAITTPIHLLPRLLGQRSFDGLYSGAKFHKYLENRLPNHQQNIEDLKIPFCAVAVGLIDGQIHAFSSGNLAYAMMASSALPELRRPVLINHNLFVDGGVFSNVPTEQARTVLKADIIIAVDIDQRFNDATVDSFKKLGSVGARLVTLELVRNDAPELMKADIVIHPEVDDIGLISRNKKDAEKALEAGITAAREALPLVIQELKSRGIEVKAPATVR